MYWKTKKSLGFQLNCSSNTHSGIVEFTCISIHCKKYMYFFIGHSCPFKLLKKPKSWIALAPTTRQTDLDQQEIFMAWAYDTELTKREDLLEPHQQTLVQMHSWKIESVSWHTMCRKHCYMSHEARRLFLLYRDQHSLSDGGVYLCYIQKLTLKSKNHICYFQSH